jgi:SSS family solute:Na+ symporter
MDHVRFWDLAVIVIYNVAIIAMGFGFLKRAGSSERFMSAGRSLPCWAVGLSIFGSYVSSISFLANPGKAYADNWNSSVFAFSMPIAAWIAARWFVGFYRQSGEVSAYQHLEHRFGAWARTYAVVCFLLMQLARLGTILYLLAAALQPLLGGSVSTLIIVMGLLVTIYPFVGGTEAVIWTGALQAVVLMAGAFACVWALLAGMPEGPGQVFEIALRVDPADATANSKFSLGRFDLSPAVSTFWVVLCFGFVTHLQNFGIDQGYVQRYITAESDQAARRSIWLGTVLFIPISLLFFFIGTALYAYYQVHPGLLPTVDTLTGEPFKADHVFPHFIAHELPPGVTGLVIAAICAAAMDSNLNCSATLILEDLYRRYFRPQAGEREAMAVLRGSTVIVGLLSIGVGLLMQGEQTILDLWWQLAGIFGGGMIGLFLLGMLAPRAGNRAGLTGITVGVLLILWLTFSPKLPDDYAMFRSPFDKLLTPVIGTLGALIAGLATAAIRPELPSSATSGEQRT